MNKQRKKGIKKEIKKAIKAKDYSRLIETLLNLERYKHLRAQSIEDVKDVGVFQDQIVKNLPSEEIVQLADRFDEWKKLPSAELEGRTMLMDVELKIKKRVAEIMAQAELQK